ncbi:hypothetical protein BU14_0070s0007 [Porphyra umbilicalis]|uniref:BRK domain-containing protein n=1 Tax=Porphyra umbilicalis TaxID=2786 RepID=A0A1X6PGN5_PORUM|nr:hypothetical protein BU14_0070s0007 [Porphyra umbilicalis]|eukprot:OSX79833.1 hypothetical protein BU14_0070s0007 [Porphyra umbilicalis]
MSIGTGLPPEEGARHVTVWHKVEGRKIAGNAAPLRRNLYRYLERHPECEVYLEQDKLLDANGGVDPLTGESLTTFHEEHVPIWHTLDGRKVTGNAAPLKKNLAAYLAKHKHCEVYDGQDKALKAAQQQAAAAAAAAGAAGGVAPGALAMGLGMVAGFGTNGASTPSSSAVSDLGPGHGAAGGGAGVGTRGLVDVLGGGGVEEDGVYGAGTVTNPASVLLLPHGGAGATHPKGAAGVAGGFAAALGGGGGVLGADDEDDAGVVVAGTQCGAYPPVQVVHVDAFGEPTHHVRLGGGGGGGAGVDLDGVVSGGPAGVATGAATGGAAGGGGATSGGGGGSGGGSQSSLLVSPSQQPEATALAASAAAQAASAMETSHLQSALAGFKGTGGGAPVAPAPCPASAPRRCPSPCGRAVRARRRRRRRPPPPPPPPPPGTLRGTS